jgi:hypothetical protein
VKLLSNEVVRAGKRGKVVVIDTDYLILDKLHITYDNILEGKADIWHATYWEGGGYDRTCTTYKDLGGELWRDLIWSGLTRS